MSVAARAGGDSGMSMKTMKNTTSVITYLRIVTRPEGGGFCWLALWLGNCLGQREKAPVSSVLSPGGSSAGEDAPAERGQQESEAELRESPRLYLLQLCEVRVLRDDKLGSAAKCRRGDDAVSPGHFLLVLHSQQAGFL